MKNNDKLNQKKISKLCTVPNLSTFYLIMLKNIPSNVKKKENKFQLLKKTKNKTGTKKHVNGSKLRSLSRKQNVRSLE